MLQRAADIYKRYTSLKSGVIRSLPVVILMPHSACNCRCVMCDIWKDNKNLKQLQEDDIAALLGSLRSYGTKMVLMSGGEALLHRGFFRLCSMLKKNGQKVSLHSTGLLLEKHAKELVEFVDDIIISLDGEEATHDHIRNIPGAFAKMKEGISALRKLDPHYSISGRSVIHKQNFRTWQGIVDSAKLLGLDSISFLPADVSSHAFNREMAWGPERQHEVMPDREELPDFKMVMEKLISDSSSNFSSRFIAESPEKIRKIYSYYSALHGLNPFPYKKCNAPWVSTVVEADGTVRPCFFHDAIGNIHQDTLDDVLNGNKGIQFRNKLDMETNETCLRCVCYLHLSPFASV
jgi:MoaA/NifB/PqqE/SkfB family radical SAM enzyme